MDRVGAESTKATQKVRMKLDPLDLSRLGVLVNLLGDLNKAQSGPHNSYIKLYGSWELALVDSYGSIHICLEHHGFRLGLVWLKDLMWGLIHAAQEGG